ncbi:ABC transporter substrate-binding protein [Nocardia sp. NPDC055029]
MKTSRLSSAAAVLLATAMIAACSGTSDTSSDGQAPPANAVKATGSPVKVMMVLAESDAANIHLDEARAGANARVKRINEVDNGLGGSGHPVEIVFCTTNLDPNIANNCARQAANDPSIIAVIGSSVTDDITQTLSDAGLANVPAIPTTAGDFTSPISFPTNGGVVTGFGAQGAIAVRDIKAKEVAYGTIQLPNALQGVAIVNQSLESNGAAPLANVVQVPLTASDLTSQVSSMAENADAVLLAVTPTMASQMMLARQQLAISVPFVAATVNFTVDSLKGLGAAAEGMRLAAYYPTEDIELAGNSQFVTDMKANGSTKFVGDLAKADWVAFDLFNEAAKGLQTLDRATVLGALKAVSGYDAGGLTPKLDFTKPGANPAFPRLVNLDYFSAVVKNGKVVSGGSGEFEPTFGSR